MPKKEKIKLPATWEIAKRIRRRWAINPKTKIQPSHKVYKRQRVKRAISEELKEGL